jgi:hypothetical protein
MSEKKNIMCVFLNAVDGRDDELNDWLDNGHIQEVVEGGGMVGAKRYQAAENIPGREQPSHSYLTIYDLGDDPAAAMGRLSAASPSMTMSEALDRSTAKAWVFIERNA